MSDVDTETAGLEPVSAKEVVALFAGLVFALGLGLGGMTDPANVLAFLDVSGDWDPALAAVMGGAIGVHLLPLWWTLRRGQALLGRLHLPLQSHIDGRLIGGSVLFGLGWGLSGLCPGPALVAVGGGVSAVWWFIVPMVVGMGLFTWVDRKVAAWTAPPAPTRVTGPSVVAAATDDEPAPACG